MFLGAESKLINRRKASWHAKASSVVCSSCAALLIAAAVGGSGCQQPEDEQIAPRIPATSGGSGGGNPVGDGGAGSGGDNDAGPAPDDAGGASGSGGAIASPGTGGAPMDASPMEAPDDMVMPPGPDASIDTPPEAPPPPPPCKIPSIDHLAHWYVASEAKAVTTPPIGSSILVTEGDHQVGKVVFAGAGWHIVAVWVTNSLTTQADLSNSMGFSLTYSATADLWVQLREVANYNGGAHFVAVLPSTGGQLQTVFVPFTPDRWSTLASLGKPTVTFAEAITQVRGLFFIDDAANTLEFDRLSFDNFTPQCQ